MPMQRLAILGENDALTGLVAERLANENRRTVARHTSRSGWEAGYSALDRGTLDAVVYLPPFRAPQAYEPDLDDARAAFEACVRADVPHVVVVSSAAVYGAGPHNTGFLSE